MDQLLHPYMTTGKVRALTIWVFVSKMMFLLFHTLSRFVIALSEVIGTSECTRLESLSSQGLPEVNMLGLWEKDVRAISEHSGDLPWVLSDVTGLIRRLTGVWRACAIQVGTEAGETELPQASEARGTGRTQT